MPSHADLSSLSDAAVSRVQSEFAARWCDRSAPVVRSAGAGVSERFAGRAIPVLSTASPAPRLPAVPSRESPSSRVPSAGLPPTSGCRQPKRHALVEGSTADGSLSRAGDECGGVGVGTERRFDEARLAGAPHESVQTCHTPLASEVGRRPWRDPQEMPHHPRNTPPMRR